MKNNDWSKPLDFSLMQRNYCYYPAVQMKFKTLVGSSFFHDFCSRKTKIPPKLQILTAFTPKLKQGIIDNQDFKSVE